MNEERSMLRGSLDRIAGHMSQENHKPIRNPQDLEPSLISRALAGDVEGMVALYEADAVVAMGGGRLARGTDEIRDYFTNLLASGFIFHAGEQFPAIIHGQLALTSSRFPNGTVSSEVARQQENGTWLWIIDVPTIGD